MFTRKKETCDIKVQWKAKRGKIVHRKKNWKNVQHKIYKKNQPNSYCLHVTQKHRYAAQKNMPKFTCFFCFYLIGKNTFIFRMLLGITCWHISATIDVNHCKWTWFFYFYNASICCTLWNKFCTKCNIYYMYLLSDWVSTLLYIDKDNAWP